jgi:hypothetical protein
MEKFLLGSLSPKIHIQQPQNSQSDCLNGIMDLQLIYD